ncbi:MAG TPA: cytochrome c [Gammaproteobacteria bacterium]|nr:cytochrome c [Gammaproteobacteria bacterium]
MRHSTSRQGRGLPSRLIVLIFLLCGAFLANAIAAHRVPPNSECPQPRFTGKAPHELYSRINPLQFNRRNRRAGKELFEDLADPSCVACHGKQGDGRGQLADQFDPPPRNFACAATVDGIPDGQLHWIIKNGSPGTAMPPFSYLTDEEIWQLVLYLRSLTDHE